MENANFIINLKMLPRVVLQFCVVSDFLAIVKSSNEKKKFLAENY